MKFSPTAQTPLEWIALKAGLVPTPLAYSHFGFMMSKFLLEAVDKGIFEAIGHQKFSIEKICTTCNLNEKSVKSLLGVLATMGLVRQNQQLFYLTPKSKKWILKDSPYSLYWLMIFDNRVCIKWMDYVGTFLETGKGLQYHETLTEDEWFYYQKAMEAAASVTSKEAVTKIPVPAGATRMLDIGGSHGLYSVALCKKYSGLTSTILDLPAAVEKAAPILEKYNTGNKVTHQPGNVLTDDLGKEKYDVIVMASVAHHFTADENKAVAKKAYDALKPGGIFTILEVLRADSAKYNGDMLSAIGDFFFALSSTSGTWSLADITHWQKEAGFSPYKKATFLTIPGYIAITGRKS
ncbi:class I SAM-dependent methyltransferase [Segetibacter sp.]|uniref:class I SAM-dependent methyltransferase n=1 Tax=Segetibacter sp. TaxID=2231182 RepID=UPI002635D87C|nr:class I SAM-dependent methyltransferase [Segetibacter sp.]MCW3079217.1 O-methyltransferase family 2 [Segetibacter sp.]